MYQLNVWLHVLMATIWVGGLIYTSAIVIPYALSKQGEERQQIIRGMARRFRTIGWVSIVILLLTGLGNLVLRLSPIRIEQLFNGEAFDPTKVDGFIARWLAWKLLFVFVMIALMLYHDITSLSAAKQHEGKPGNPPHNRAGSIAAALATLLAILVVYISVRLVRG
jgi:putative copper resistance protein D